MSIDTTEAELNIVQMHVQEGRKALMEHAHRIAIAAGFLDRHARFMAVEGMLIGAAQLYAMSQHGSLGLYEVFKALCAINAVSDAKQISINSHIDLGPEVAQGIISGGKL